MDYRNGSCKVVIDDTMVRQPVRKSLKSKKKRNEKTITEQSTENILEVPKCLKWAEHVSQIGEYPSQKAQNAFTATEPQMPLNEKYNLFSHGSTKDASPEKTMMKRTFRESNKKYLDAFFKPNLSNISLTATNKIASLQAVQNMQKDQQAEWKHGVSLANSGEEVPHTHADVDKLPKNKMPKRLSFKMVKPSEKCLSQMKPPDVPDKLKENENQPSKKTSILVLKEDLLKPPEMPDKLKQCNDYPFKNILTSAMSTSLHYNELPKNKMPKSSGITANTNNTQDVNDLFKYDTSLPKDNMPKTSGICLEDVDAFPNDLPKNEIPSESSTKLYNSASKVYAAMTSDIIQTSVLEPNKFHETALDKLTNAYLETDARDLTKQSNEGSLQNEWVTLKNITTALSEHSKPNSTLSNNIAKQCKVKDQVQVQNCTKKISKEKRPSRQTEIKLQPPIKKCYMVEVDKTTSKNAAEKAINLQPTFIPSPSNVRKQSPDHRKIINKQADQKQENPLVSKSVLPSKIARPRTALPFTQNQDVLRIKRGENTNMTRESALAQPSKIPRLNTAQSYVDLQKQSCYPSKIGNGIQTDFFKQVQASTAEAYGDLPKRSQERNRCHASPKPASTVQMPRPVRTNVLLPLWGDLKQKVGPINNLEQTADHAYDAHQLKRERKTETPYRKNVIIEKHIAKKNSPVERRVLNHKPQLWKDSGVTLAPNVIQENQATENNTNSNFLYCKNNLNNLDESPKIAPKSVMNNCPPGIEERDLTNLSKPQNTSNSQPQMIDNRLNNSTLQCDSNKISVLTTSRSRKVAKTVQYKKCDNIGSCKQLHENNKKKINARNTTSKSMVELSRQQAIEKLKQDKTQQVWSEQQRKRVVQTAGQQKEEGRSKSTLLAESTNKTDPQLVKTNVIQGKHLVTRIPKPIAKKPETHAQENQQQGDSLKQMQTQPSVDPLKTVDQIAVPLEQARKQKNRHLRERPGVQHQILNQLSQFIPEEKFESLVNETVDQHQGNLGTRETRFCKPIRPQKTPAMVVTSRGKESEKVRTTNHTNRTKTLLVQGKRPNTQLERRDEVTKPENNINTASKMVRPQVEGTDRIKPKIVTYKPNLEMGKHNLTFGRSKAIPQVLMHDWSKSDNLPQDVKLDKSLKTGDTIIPQLGADRQTKNVVLVTKKVAVSDQMKQTCGEKATDVSIPINVEDSKVGDRNEMSPVNVNNKQTAEKTTADNNGKLSVEPASKLEKPYRLIEDNEIEETNPLKEVDLYPKIKSVDGSSCLAHIDMKNIAEKEFTYPVNQTHPRMLTMKQPPEEKTAATNKFPQKVINVPGGEAREVQKMNREQQYLNQDRKKDINEEVGNNLAHYETAEERPIAEEKKVALKQIHDISFDKLKRLSKKTSKKKTIGELNKESHRVHFVNKHWQGMAKRSTTQMRSAAEQERKIVSQPTIVGERKTEQLEPKVRNVLVLPESIPKEAATFPAKSKQDAHKGRDGAHGGSETEKPTQMEEVTTAQESVLKRNETFAAKYGENVQKEKIGSYNSVERNQINSKTHLYDAITNRELKLENKKQIHGGQNVQQQREYYGFPDLPDVNSLIRDSKSSTSDKQSLKQLKQITPQPTRFANNIDGSTKHVHKATRVTPLAVIMEEPTKNTIPNNDRNVFHSIEDSKTLPISASTEEKMIRNTKQTNPLAGDIQSTTSTKQTNATGNSLKDQIQACIKLKNDRKLNMKASVKEPKSITQAGINIPMSQLDLHLLSLPSPHFKPADTTARYKQSQIPSKMATNQTHTNEKVQKSTLATFMAAGNKASRCGCKSTPPSKGGGAKTSKPEGGGATKPPPPPPDQPRDGSEANAKLGNGPVRPESREKGSAEVRAPPEEWPRNAEPSLTGLSRYFNSTTTRGRSNVARATFALLGLFSMYGMIRQPTPK